MMVNLQHVLCEGNDATDFLTKKSVMSDTSKDMSCNEVRFEIESNELGRPKRIVVILHLRSGMIVSFSSDSLVLED